MPEGFIGLVRDDPFPVRFRIEHGLLGAITVTPAEAELEPGERLQLVAQFRDLHDHPSCLRFHRVCRSQAGPGVAWGSVRHAGDLRHEGRWERSDQSDQHLWLRLPVRLVALGGQLGLEHLEGDLPLMARSSLRPRVEVLRYGAIGRKRAGRRGHHAFPCSPRRAAAERRLSMMDHGDQGTSLFR